MNIDSSTPLSGMNANFRPQPQNVSLSDEQKAEASEILSQYDPENLSQEDREAIRTAFQEAGIGPGEDLKDVFESQGFEMKKPGSGQPPSGPPPGPPPSSMSDEESDAISAFLEKYDAGEASDSDVEDLISLLRQFGSGSTGVLFSSQA